MLNNYLYFIIFAEELNISRAARRLHISHQCLNKHLKNLEKAYGITLYERSPNIALTPAGRIILDTFQQIQFLDRNLENRLDDIRLSKTGLIRFGTTEGRYRILIPELLPAFKKSYPQVEVIAQTGTSDQLCEYIQQNQLDIALLNEHINNSNRYEIHSILTENLYLVISDDMLAQYFPYKYPECKKSFLKGINLAEFHEVPFILNFPESNLRKALKHYLQANSLHLNCIFELGPLDLHLMLAAHNYAACFCWTMYLSSVKQINRFSSSSHLNVFPISNPPITNQLALMIAKGRILPNYGRHFMTLIRKKCAEFSLNNSTNSADVHCNP